MDAKTESQMEVTDEEFKDIINNNYFLRPQNRKKRSCQSGMDVSDIGSS